MGALRGLAGLHGEDFGPKTWRAVFAELIATLLFVFLGAGTVVVVTAVIGALLVKGAVVGQFEGNLGAHALNLEVLDGARAG